MRITEDKDAEVVSIDGYRLEGWIDETRCADCDSQLVHASKYDALFCPSCNVWSESPAPRTGEAPPGRIVDQRQQTAMRPAIFKTRDESSHRAAPAR
jgi:hypothetical protein